MFRFHSIQTIALSCLIAAPALAEENAATNPAFAWEAEATFFGVANSRFKRKSFDGEVNEVDFGLRAVASKQLGGGPQIRAGIEWQRYDFGLPGHAPLPNTLQSLALVIGADFQIGEAWLFRLEATPGFYNGRAEFSADGFNVPVVFGGSYFVSSDLQLIAGIELDVNRKYPVLGALGVRWKFAPNLVLNAVLPAPRVEYSFSKSLTGYVGADLRETTYRLNDTFGRSIGKRKLDNAIVDYTQIRVGAGAAWAVTSNLTIECEAGVVAVHDFNYHRAEISVSSDGYPAYGGISLKAAF